ncbi:MAG: retroviral-like aspartic protease family protein [Chloroflexi bacterium]|nr:retroviral-like aspartic protease family protein [Chloroflexota bacterium]
MHTNSTPYRALIDTGAKRTSVDRDLATKLGFAIKDSEEIGTVAGPDVVPVYDVADIHIPSLGLHVPLYFLGARLHKNLDCQVLIGRDILANYHMTYDGRTGRVTLSDEAPHHAATKRVGVGLLEKVKEFGRFFGS